MFTTGPGSNGLENRGPNLKFGLYPEWLEIFSEVTENLESRFLQVCWGWWGWGWGYQATRCTDGEVLFEVLAGFVYLFFSLMSQ